MNHPAHIEPSRLGTQLITWAVIWTFIALYGCHRSAGDPEDEFLIRVGDHKVSVGDFNRAFEIAKSAYPHNLMQETSAYREAQVRLLNQMTEELILLERASELNISVTEEEVEAKVESIISSTRS